MNRYLQNFIMLFGDVAHPAAGRAVAEKKKKRTSTMVVLPKGTPDSLNIRDGYKSQNSIRRNPAP